MEELIRQIIREELRAALSEYFKRQVDWLTRKEAAELIGVSPRTIDSWIKKGVISAKQIGGKVLIAREEIDKATKRKVKSQEESLSEIVNRLTRE